MTMEAEISEAAAKLQGPRSRRVQEGPFPGALPTTFRLLASRTVRESTAVALSHLSVVICCISPSRLTPCSTISFLISHSEESGKGTQLYSSFVAEVPAAQRG